MSDHNNTYGMGGCNAYIRVSDHFFYYLDSIGTKSNGIILINTKTLSESKELVAETLFPEVDYFSDFIIRLISRALELDSPIFMRLIAFWSYVYSYCS